MKNITSAFHYALLLILMSMLTSYSNNTFAQYRQPYVRVAKIEIDNYKAALKEHAEAAISKEPGVLTLYAVYDKEHPTHVTVFEIYASVPAYQFHIQTTHFLNTRLQ